MRDYWEPCAPRLERKTMWALALIVTILVLVFVVYPRWRLQRALRSAFPSHYSKILRRHLAPYRHMPADLQLQLKQKIKQFLHEKTFVGCNGLEVTDEMRVTIAGRACMLLLNRETEVYPRLTHILIYPDIFQVPRKETQVGGVVVEHSQTLAGESWSDGRVVLAWHEVLHPSVEDGRAHDVVVHEFAHQLDSEDGVTDGAPPLPSTKAYRAWAAVMSREYERLQSSVQTGIETLIDPYGTTNPAEFFAVCSEAYFYESDALAYYHPHLYQEFYKFYRVDPRDWK